MQAVIMAGGMGTRLKELTKDEIPKPMVTVLGRPILEWQIQQLKKCGVVQIILIIGHRGEKIEDYFGDGESFGVSIRYVREQEPLGTAGAFYYLKDMLLGKHFLLVFGDVLFDIDIGRMERFHMERNAFATLFVHPNSHPYDSDLIVADRKGNVTAFDSKKNERNDWYDNCVNAGFYILDRRICDRLELPRKTDLEKDILSKLIDEQEAVYAYRSPEYIKDVGTVDRITAAAEELKSGYAARRNLSRMQRCIFMDRDGTINIHKGFICCEEDFVLETFATEALRLVNQSGYLGIVVTNQPVVARGLCAVHNVERIHNKLKTLLGRDGVYLDDIVYCPHHPDKGYPEENPAYKIKCSCRKPAIGMITDCCERFHINPADSWMVGDTTVDIQTGKNAGLRTVLVRTGEAGQDQKYDIQPDYICENLLEAVRLILSFE